MPPISVILARGQSLYVSHSQGKLMRSITAITLFLFTVLGATASHATYTWTTIAHPGATSTTVSGIDGANIVGGYKDSSYNSYSTLYDGSTWTTHDNPSGTYTSLSGIDGANITRYGGTCRARMSDCGPGVRRMGRSRAQYGEKKQRDRGYRAHELPL